MTVCIAALFEWNYAQPDEPANYGKAIITVSDRMITVGDVQYEPMQFKAGELTQRSIILIAGDYTVHSQAIRSVQQQARNSPAAIPLNLAQMYGAEIQAIQRKMAEDEVLAPLGLNTDSFHAQQKEFSDSYVMALKTEMQSHAGVEVEALIVGMEGTTAPHLSRG